MKTSNKILTGLLVVVFAVPLMLAATIKAKMNRGEYVVRHFEQSSRAVYRSGTFTSFKVIKVISPAPELLQCRLTFSDTMSYEYTRYGAHDSVAVYTSSDTLFIRYVTLHTNPDERVNGYNDVNVKVQLPSVASLVIDGAEVFVESMPADGISVILYNNGSIKDAGKKIKSENRRVIRETTGESSRARRGEVVEPKIAPIAVVNAEFNREETINYKTVAKPSPGVEVKSDLMHGMLYRM